MEGSVAPFQSLFGLSKEERGGCAVERSAAVRPLRSESPRIKLVRIKAKSITLYNPIASRN